MTNVKKEIEQIDTYTYKIIEYPKSNTAEAKKKYRIVKNPVNIWIIGNTGMRNPWRVAGGFKVCVDSNYIGHLKTNVEQQAFKKILYQSGEIGGETDKDQSASIVRKYRLMFNKFGFMYPEITKKDGFTQNEIGPVYGITPMGRTFYEACEAQNIAAQQECFLRGLVVPMENLKENAAFSPLCWVLQVMLNLDKRIQDTKINFVEFMLYVQTTNPNYDIEKVVDEILSLRQRRKKAENKKKFDRIELDNFWQNRYLKEENNFKDYADMNIRYLVATGIVKRSGRGLILTPGMKAVASEIIKHTVSEKTYKERLIELCNGSKLPTDSMEQAYIALQELMRELEIYHIKYTVPELPLDSVKNVNTVRSILKEQIDQYQEETYASQQSQEWQEIYEYMNLLIVNNGKEKELGEDYSIRVPKSEAAAYLEWTLWRAFLAIDHITNKPYDARGFKIDQDYLPVGTAPGGGPDMIFEFKDYTIVVEVTMSTNSRQEAMEGEPVRRHVADILMARNKPVYGVFIANKIDSNTAETFRIGCWFNQKDEELSLQIVPFTLKQFAAFFQHMFLTDQHDPETFLRLFETCFTAKKEGKGPVWKRRINDIVMTASQA